MIVQLRFGRNGDDTMKLKHQVFFLLLVVIILWICFLPYVMDNETLPERVERKFSIQLPTEDANELYYASDWDDFGNGAIYSVWQYQSAKSLLQMEEWDEGNVIDFLELYNKTYETAQVESYYRIQDEDTIIYSTGRRDEKYDDVLVLIYAPEMRMGDGLKYRNLLFIIEIDHGR